MQDENWVRTIAIGGVLSFLGFLVVPLLLVYGYIGRVIRGSLDDESEPPTFEDWEELLVTGLKLVVIGIVYMLVPLVVAAVTIGGSILAIATGTEGGVAAGLAGLAGGLLLTSLLSLVFGYVAVAAVVNFVREDRFGAAFDLARLRRIVVSREYALAWLLSVAVFIGAGVVTGFLNALPIIGTVFGAFVFFYAQMVAADLWADGYTAALEFEYDEDQANLEEPAV